MASCYGMGSLNFRWSLSRQQTISVHSMNDCNGAHCDIRVRTCLVEINLGGCLLSDREFFRNSQIPPKPSPSSLPRCPPYQYPGRNPLRHFLHLRDHADLEAGSSLATRKVSTSRLPKPLSMNCDSTRTLLDDSDARPSASEIRKDSPPESECTSVARRPCPARPPSAPACH